MTTFGNFRVAGEQLEKGLVGHGVKVGTTRELTNVFYGVTQPSLKDLSPHLPWADTEFEERVSGNLGFSHNPGEAWKLQREVWEPMLEEHKDQYGLIYRSFSYTYSHRMSYQISNVLEELRNNPDSREALIMVWDAGTDSTRLGRRRVPCTIGYQFLIRDRELHMTYLQRSCNFYKHYQDDVYLARRLQEWVAERLQVPSGPFCHWIGSFHIY